MINLTLSTNGLSRAGNDCHAAVEIDHTKRIHGPGDSVEIVTLVLTRAQAIDLMDDLRSQIDYSDRTQDAVASRG